MNVFKKAIDIALLFHRRPKFRKWIELETIRSKAAVEADLAGLITAYVSAAAYLPAWILDRLFWVDAVTFFYELVSKNSPKINIPMFDPRDKSADTDKVSWDYPDRSYSLWLNIFAKQYGWKKQDIDRLDVDVACALIQEILTDQQLDKEFQWSMTEIAYPYNESTKTSKFSPLDRPYWMKVKAPEIKIVKIPKWVLPIGNGVDLSGMEAYFEKQREAERERIENDKAQAQKAPDTQKA